MSKPQPNYGGDDELNELAKKFKIFRHDPRDQPGTSKRDTSQDANDAMTESGLKEAQIAEGYAIIQANWGKYPNLPRDPNPKEYKPPIPTDRERDKCTITNPELNEAAGLDSNNKPNLDFHRIFATLVYRGVLLDAGKRLCTSLQRRGNPLKVTAYQTREMIIDPAVHFKPAPPGWQKIAQRRLQYMAFQIFLDTVKTHTISGEDWHRLLAIILDMAFAAHGVKPELLNDSQLH